MLNIPLLDFLRYFYISELKNVVNISECYINIKYYTLVVYNIRPLFLHQMSKKILQKQQLPSTMCNNCTLVNNERRQ